MSSGDDSPLPGPLTRPDALQMVHARTSREDMRNLEALPDGAAMVAVIADIMVDQSARLDRTITARHLVQRKSDVNPIASGPTFATTSLLIARDPARLGVAVVMPNGTVFQTNEKAKPHRYLSTSPLSWAAGELGPKLVPVQSEFASYAGTVLAGSITTFGSVANGTQGDRASVVVSGANYYLNRTGGDFFLASMVGLYVLFTGGTNIGLYARIAAVNSTDQAVLVPNVPLAAETLTATWVVQEWTDFGYSVTQPTDTTQGTDGELDALAREANRQRRTGENDATLISEMLKLGDCVEPTALIRAANRVLGPYGPIAIYETGSSAIDCDPTIGLRAFPGIVCGRSPCGEPPDAPSLAAPAAGAAAPVPGLACMAPLDMFFIVRWDGAGLGDPGGYAGVTTGSKVDSKPPHGAACGVTPVGGRAFGDAHLRREIGAALNRIKGGGVRWRWYPRKFFGGV